MKKYAKIENGVVTNVVMATEVFAANHDNYVDTYGIPVEIGDTYENDIFYRDGEKVYSDSELKDIIINILTGVIDDEELRTL